MGSGIKSRHIRRNVTSTRPERGRTDTQTHAAGGWPSGRGSSESPSKQASEREGGTGESDGGERDRERGPHTSVAGHALLCRFCGLEAFAARWQDRTLLDCPNFTWGRGWGVGVGAGRLISFLRCQPCLKIGFEATPASKSQRQCSGLGKPGL